MQSKKARILYLDTRLAIGGAQELRLGVLKYLNRDKYDIRLCCLIEKGKIGEEMEGLGFQVDVIRTSERLCDIRSLFPILAYLKRTKFDIVHTCLPNANLYGRIAALLARVPCIVSEEQNYCERYNTSLGFIFRPINLFLSRYTDKIIACSNAVAKRLSRDERIPQDKFLVLHNSIDPQKFEINCTKDEMRAKLGLGSDDIVIGYTGALSPIKGTIHLLKAS